MHKPTHTERPISQPRPTMINKERVLRILRDQRQILVSSPSSAMAQGGVLELDRAIQAVKRLG